MLFNSIPFIIFIAIVLLLYRFLNYRKQNILLLLSSYFFYGYWDWRFIFLLFILTLVNFHLGQKIYLTNNSIHKRWLLFISISFSLGILCFFKYYNFFIQSAATVLSTIGFEPHLPVLKVILPVGISFYTFQALSYTIDIYRCSLKPTERFFDFALFVSFFPQLVAGPIERASNLLPQIIKKRYITKENVLTGVNLVLLGYFKKIAIADTLAPIVESIFSEPGQISNGQLWTGVYAFTFQIYGDFSGYTDIARGIARIFGFELMKNFNAPYLSRSIIEFWRRWHISLSTWLRDYLYIPLGGNRRGAIRTYVNLMITMLLGGLWHGASWTFVIWGIMHGIYLAGNRFIIRENKAENLSERALPRWSINFAKTFLTFHIVAITWVFFRAPDFNRAMEILTGLFRFQTFDGISSAVLFAGSLMIALDIIQTFAKTHTWLVKKNMNIVIRYAVIQILIISVLSAAIAQIQIISPFIYFQF